MSSMRREVVNIVCCMLVSQNSMFIAFNVPNPAGGDIRRIWSQSHRAVSTYMEAPQQHHGNFCGSIKSWTR